MSKSTINPVKPFFPPSSPPASTLTPPFEAFRYKATLWTVVKLMLQILQGRVKLLMELSVNFGFGNHRRRDTGTDFIELIVFPRATESFASAVERGGGREYWARAATSV